MAGLPLDDWARMAHCRGIHDRDLPHQAGGRLPRQPRVLEDSDGKAVAVLIVSDGAGSALRARQGSDLSCRTILDAVETFLADGGSVASIDLEIARSWVGMVGKAISLHAQESGSIPRDYACTLLAAIIADDAAAFLQIGDGAIVVPDEAGIWTWIHWPQRGDYANITYFVTDEGATDRLAFNLVKRSIEEVSLFTDGIEPLVLHYSSQTVHSPFFDRMFEPLRASGIVGIDQNLSAGLERYLASPTICDRTDDDKTLILATRRRASVGASETSTK